MKKIFYIFLSIFSLFFLSDNVFALEYSVNDNVYTVSDLDSFTDYCYYTYVKDNYDYMIIYSDSSNLYYCGFTNASLYYSYDQNQYRINSSSSLKIYVHRTSSIWNYDRDEGSSSRVSYSNFYYSNTNIYSSNSLSDVYISSNISFNNIENKYIDVYSDTFDSTIHDITIRILGSNIPIEFDFIYILFDFLILLLLVFTIIFPFIITIKLLGGNL